MTYYKQCNLLGVTKTGDSVATTSWIPEEFAYQGNLIRLKDDPTVWSVRLVGHRLPEDQVLENSQDYKRTRKASDI